MILTLNKEAKSMDNREWIGELFRQVVHGEGLCGCPDGAPLHALPLMLLVPAPASGIPRSLMKP